MENIWERFLTQLKGRHNSKWGIEKIIEFGNLLTAHPELLVPAREKFTRTEFYIKQKDLRRYILHACSKSAWTDPYDRNVEDVIWSHNQWVNDKLFTVISMIVICCGGRITYQG